MTDKFEKGQFGKFKRGDNDFAYGWYVHFNGDFHVGSTSKVFPSCDLMSDLFIACNEPLECGAKIPVVMLGGGTNKPQTFKEWATAMMEQMPGVWNIGTNSAGNVYYRDDKNLFFPGKKFVDEPDTDYTRADLFPEPEKPKPDYNQWVKERAFCKFYDDPEKAAWDIYGVFGVLKDYNPKSKCPFTSGNFSWKYCDRYE